MHSMDTTFNSFQQSFVKYSEGKLRIDFLIVDRRGQSIFMKLFAEEVSSLAEKPTSITFKNASYLKANQLKLFLHPELKSLKIEDCKCLKIFPCIPNNPLEKLILNKVSLTSLEGELPSLKYLAVENCQEIQSIHLHSPQLEGVNFINNPCLKSIKILEPIGKINSLFAPSLGYREMRCVQELNGHASSINALVTFPNGVLASASSDRTIKLWDPIKGILLGTLIGHKGPVYALTLLSDGTLVSGSWDGSIKYWDPIRKVLLKSIENAHTSSILALNSFKNDFLVSASEDNTLKIWSPRGEFFQLSYYQSPVFFVKRLPYDRIAGGSRSNKIKIIRVRKQNYETEIMTFSSKLNNVEIFNNDLMAGVEQNGDIRVWENSSGKIKFFINAHTTNQLIFSHIEANTLVTMPKDNEGTIKLWDLGSGVLKQTLTGHTGSVRSVALISENILASGSEDQSIRIWK